MKSIKWTMGLCLMVTSAFAFGVAGSASAASLLFIPHSGKYPYHFIGTGGESVLETVSGSKVKSPSVHVLGLVLNATLLDVHLEFLKAETSFFGFPVKCHTAGFTETILLNLLGHFGKAHKGATEVPATLLLIPGGFSFECAGNKVEVSGSVIGQITSPALNTASELMRVVFNQSKGVQELKSFLLGTQLLTNQHESSKLGNGALEESGQSGEAHLLALPGQGTFLLVSP